MIAALSGSLLSFGGERSFIEVLEQQEGLQLLKGKTDLTTTLSYVSVITEITLEALEAFLIWKLRRHDGLVGDTACHLRACALKDLSDLLLVSKEWKEELGKAKEVAQAILKNLPEVKAKVEKEIPSNKEFKGKYGSQIKASSFCTSLSILQPLSENVRMVVESYLLKQTKKLIKKEGVFHMLHDVTCAAQLESYNGHQTTEKLSIKRLKTLTECAQRDLSALSVRYLHREARLLKDSQTNQLAQEILLNDLRRDEEGRFLTPCFYSLETLLQRMIDKKQNLLIDVTRWTPDGKKIDRLKMLYTPNPETRTFERASVLDATPQPVLVIVGSSIREDQERLSATEYIQLFRSQPLEEVLNGNWAQHAQYTEKMDVTTPPRSDSRREAFAQKAHAMGCSAKNMSLFVVYHILCDDLIDALSNQEFL